MKFKIGDEVIINHVFHAGRTAKILQAFNDKTDADDEFYEVIIDTDDKNTKIRTYYSSCYLTLVNSAEIYIRLEKMLSAL